MKRREREEERPAKGRGEDTLKGEELERDRGIHFHQLESWLKRNVASRGRGFSAHKILQSSLAYSSFGLSRSVFLKHNLLLVLSLPPSLSVSIWHLFYVLSGYNNSLINLFIHYSMDKVDLVFTCHQHMCSGVTCILKGRSSL